MRVLWSWSLRRANLSWFLLLFSLRSQGTSLIGQPPRRVHQPRQLSYRPFVPFPFRADPPYYHLYKSIVELAAQDPSPAPANRLARFAKDRSHETRAHHRHHRTRRLLPCRVAAFERLRGPWNYPPRQHLQYFAHRSHLPGFQSAGNETLPASRRLGQHGMDSEFNLQSCAGRALPSRGAEPRQSQLRYSRIHRRRNRPRHDETSRSDSPQRREDAVLPGVEFGNVWLRSSAAKRDDGFSAAQPLRRRKSLRALDDADLPRGLSSLRRQRYFVQSREST